MSSSEAPTNAPDSAFPFWGLEALFERHLDAFVAELLRNCSATKEWVDENGVRHVPGFLALIPGDILPAPGPVPPPSYMAMCDPNHRAGRLLIECGRGVWAEIIDAYREGGAPAHAVETLPQRNTPPLRRLLADLLFWRLHQLYAGATDPTTVPGAAAALTEVDALRTRSVGHRSASMSDFPEVQVFGGVAVLLGYELELAPQPAQLLKLALRPGGTSFGVIKTELEIPEETESGISARVTRLRGLLEKVCRRTPFTIEVTTKGKCLSAFIQTKLIQTTG